MTKNPKEPKLNLNQTLTLMVTLLILNWTLSLTMITWCYVT